MGMDAHIAFNCRRRASLSVKYRRRWEYIAISWKLFASVYEAEGASARHNCTPQDPDQASLLDVQGVRLCWFLAVTILFFHIIFVFGRCHLGHLNWSDTEGTTDHWTSLFLGCRNVAINLDEMKTQIIKGLKL